MKFHKRLIAVLLAAVMTAGLLPTAYGAQADAVANTAEADRAFAAIDTALDNLSAKKAAATEAAKSEAAKEAVEALGYTVTEHGSQFTWVADGITCVYSPRLRRIAETATPIDGYVDDGQIVTVDYSRRGTGPDSKNVALIEPYYGLDSSFTTQYQTECSSIAAATGGTYTLYKTTNATVDNVAAALQNSAVVVFDSHGDTDYVNPYDDEDFVSGATTSYLCLQSGTGLTSDDYAGDHALYGGPAGQMKYYLVDGTAITNHLTGEMPNTLVWMAICLGMATDGMEKPFMEHGAGVVYGYSQSVTFDGDYDYEKDFWSRMKSGATVADAIAYMKEQNGNWDPGMGASTITQAKRMYAAFPVVVSNVDAYPGHGNVDALQSVYSDWTLAGQSTSYTVTAVSADESMGTVSRSGGQITAEPQEGYLVSGYTVVPEGACTVTQNGNTFQVSNIQQDCTVTISFAPRERASITYVVPAGVTCGATTAYAGDSVKLPAPQGTPAADKYDYRFVGWVTAPVEAAAACGTVYVAGTDYALTGDTTLYALYSYLVQDGAASGQYHLVTGSREDWSGEYVLCGNDTAVLDASGTYTGSTIGSANASIALADSGITLQGGVMRNVSDAYVYVVQAVGGGSYSIRMKGSSNYLAYTGTSNSLNTLTDCTEKQAQWTLSFADGEAVITNAANTGKTLRYNATSDLFRCYSSGQTAVSLYAADGGTTYYTTRLENKAEDPCADGHSFGAWEQTTAPTYSEPGSERRICTVCGADEVRAISRLALPFVDVKDDAYYSSAVAWALDYAITYGDDDTHFAPQSPCTREQVVTFLWRASGKPAARTETCPFLDVKPGDYSYEAILWAAERGITVGTDDTHFSPKATVTRAQFVTFLWRSNGKPEAALRNVFGDVDPDAYYAPAVMWAVEQEITQGTGGDKFSPDDFCLREQVVTFLYRNK